MIESLEKRRNDQRHTLCQAAEGRGNDHAEFRA
jgi:hypothetical protein